jgi:hypothetical protein
MSSPFLIFESDPPLYKLFIEETERGYHISFKDCMSEVWDYDICDFFNLSIHNYRKKLRSLGGYTIDDYITYLAKKEDLQPILEWLESLQMAKKLAGEL